MRTILLFSLLLNGSVVLAYPSFDLVQFNDSGLKQYEGGKFTFPMVLFFNKKGRLYRSITGKRIFDINSYNSKLEAPIKTVVTSPPLSKLLKYFSIKKLSSKATIIYLDLKGYCPPCKPMKSKFDVNIRNNIKDRFEFIYLEGLG